MRAGRRCSPPRRRSWHSRSPDRVFIPVCLRSDRALAYTGRVKLNRATLAGLFLAATLWGQRPAPILSPEVQPDRRVTFRLRAPKASEVTLTGDWMGSNAPPKLT